MFLLEVTQYSRCTTEMPLWALGMPDTLVMAKHLHWHLSCATAVLHHF
jgi:hypothetical protein